MQQINYYDLFDRVKLTALVERRSLILIKFVLKFGESELFENWFKFRNGTEKKFGTIILSTCKSETVKKSILRSCVEIWNDYVRKCKNFEALSLSSFMTFIESLVLDKRKNNI